MEFNYYNRLNWINDYQSPFLPTPNPPDPSVQTKEDNPSKPSTCDNNLQLHCSSTSMPLDTKVSNLQVMEAVTSEPSTTDNNLPQHNVSTPTRSAQSGPTQSASLSPQGLSDMDIDIDQWHKELFPYRNTADNLDSTSDTETISNGIKATVI